MNTRQSLEETGLTVFPPIVLQTTAVILLGVIGALFDLEAQKDPRGEVALDNHLERVTAKALMFLVLRHGCQMAIARF